MNAENQIPEANPGLPPQGAVSVYGQTDPMDDFPVLKAFQQYVDAEQAKAHKRMMTVSVFFTILLLIVISVFMFIIFGLNQNNPNNHDLTLRLINMNQELMARGTQQPQPVVDLKTQEENLELKARVREQELERKFNERLAAVQAAALQPSAATSAAPSAAPAFTEADRAAMDELRKKEASLNKLEERLKAREAKVAEDAKQVREERIDLQQRKLYPDQFSPEARKKADAEIRAAQDESEQAKAEAREAIDKATNAELAAQAALNKAEDAERAAELKEARLAKREKELEERERLLALQRKEIEEQAADAEMRASMPQPKPVVKPAQARPSAIEVDEVLTFLDNLDDSPAEPHPADQKPSAPAPVGQAIGDAYEMPLE